jgi:NADH pyrophosphatase NudC (nudix superfamily)
VPDAEPDDAKPTSPEIAEVRWFATDALPDLQHETASALVALSRIDDHPPGTRRTASTPSSARAI